MTSLTVLKRRRPAKGGPFEYAHLVAKPQQNPPANSLGEGKKGLSVDPLALDAKQYAQLFTLSKPSPNSIPPDVENCFGWRRRLSGDLLPKTPISKGHVSLQQSDRQKLYQQVARTSDSHGNVSHENIVNPQEESTTLDTLPIDVGSKGTFQIVKPNLLVQVHDRTMSPTNAWQLTSEIVADLAANTKDRR